MSSCLRVWCSQICFWQHHKWKMGINAGPDPSSVEPQMEILGRMNSEQRVGHFLGQFH